VLAKQEKIRVRSEKFHGGAGLKRWKRSRGFPAKFARHRNFRGNYRSFQGLDREKLETGSNGGGWYCSSNSRRFRA
jgi:hypothetical protein